MKPVSSSIPAHPVKNQPAKAKNAAETASDVGHVSPDQMAPSQDEARAKLARLMGVSVGGLKQFHQARQAALAAPAPATLADSAPAAISRELMAQRQAYQAALLGAKDKD